MKYCAVIIAFVFPILAFGDPQEDLCAAIRGRDNPKILDAVLKGASLSRPCRDGNYPIHLAIRSHPNFVPVLLEVGVDPDTLDPRGNSGFSLALLRDRQLGLELLRFRFKAKSDRPNSRPASPKETELEGDIDIEDFVDLGAVPGSDLPTFLKREGKKHGWVAWATSFVVAGQSKLYDLDEYANKVVKLPPKGDMGPEKREYDALMRFVKRVGQMRKLYAAIPEVEWRVLEKPAGEPTHAIEANLTILRTTRAFILDLIYVLKRLQAADAAYEASGLEDMEHLGGFEKSRLWIELESKIQEAHKDEAAIERYIKHVENQVASQNGTNIAEALGRVLGVDLPDAYGNALLWCFRKKPELAAKVEVLTRFFRLLNQSLDPKNTGAAREAIIETVADLQREIASLQGENRLHVRLIRELLMAVSSVASPVFNTQFSTDSFARLLVSEPFEGSALWRQLEAENAFVRFANFDAGRVPKDMDNEELQTLYLLGAKGVSELHEQRSAALRFAPNWTCPLEGLGLLFHAGWQPVLLLPAPGRAAKLSAIRTLGIAHGSSFAMRQVKMDFSELGEITFEQAMKLLQYIEMHLNDKQRRLDFEQTYVAHLSTVFLHVNKAAIISISSRFVNEIHKALENLDAQLRLGDSTALKIREVLGVEHLPPFYLHPLEGFILRSEQGLSLLKSLLSQLRTASGASEHETSALSYRALETMVQILPLLTKTENEAMTELLRVLTSYVGLSNTQFHTNALCSLLIPVELLEQPDSLSQEDYDLCFSKFIPREYPVEQRLERLVKGTETNLESTQKDLALLGVDALEELKAQWNHAVKTAVEYQGKGFYPTRWKFVGLGLGLLYHAGWANASVPTVNGKPVVFKATRTLGMTRGLNATFAAVDIDFSALGPITFKQAKALMSLIIALSDEQDTSLEGEGFEKVFKKLFQKISGEFPATGQEAIIAKKARAFIESTNKSLHDMHTVLRISLPK